MSRASQSARSSATSRKSTVPEKSAQSSTLPQRTLDDVRDQVANEVAVRTITKSETVDGARVGVMLTLSKNDDEEFLRRVAGVLQHQLQLQDHVCTSPVPIFVVKFVSGLCNRDHGTIDAPRL